MTATPRARTGIGLTLVAAACAGASAGWVPPDEVVRATPERENGAALRKALPGSTTPVMQSTVRALSVEARYEAMRDDVNPKPRLLLIDTWARGASPDAPLDLLTHALVDRDATVRERAQALFDRRLAAH